MSMCRTVQIGCFLALTLSGPLAATAQTIGEDQIVRGTPADRGLIANPILLRQAVRSAYFFAGSWRKALPGGWAANAYGRLVGDNTGLYTMYPADSKHLGWSEGEDKRAFTLDAMQTAHVNTVTMSDWGMASDDRWAFWAPMQTSVAAQDQLFAEAVGRPMVIIPAIESGRCTKGNWQGWDGQPNHPKLPGAWEGRSASFNFASEFPWFRGDPQHPNPENGHSAPLLVAQIEELVRRYVTAPADPRWRSRWARLYDRTGTPRLAINLLHVASNQIDDGADGVFARTFADIAQQVKQDTLQDVGFTLDIVSAKSTVDQNCGFANADAAKWRDRFIASPDVTGPLLRDTDAVLAVQAFIPEVWTGLQFDEGRSRPWKRDFIRRWVASGVPVILDVDPGYRTHADFDSSKPLVGWGWNDDWFNFQSEMKATGIRGITFNTWNGYTEGYVGVPVAAGQGIDRSASDWLTRLYAADPQICDHWHFVGRQPTFHVFGAICDKWRGMDGSIGALGSPTSSEHALTCRPAARQTDFQLGDVVWSAGHSVAVYGDIAKQWRRMGGACGSPGFPLGDETGPTGTRSQLFEHGSMHWAAGGGAFWLPNPGPLHP